MIKKTLIFVAVISVSLTACSSGQVTSSAESETSPSSEKKVEVKEEPEFHSDSGADEDRKGEQKSKSEDEKQSTEQQTKDGLTIVGEPSSLTVVVNKQRKLPEGYTPPELIIPDVPFYFDESLPKKHLRQEAAHALEDLFKGAGKAGQELVAASGYRSYQRQKKIYDGYVDTYGEEKANTFSARPGTSEHQTGLAMDVTSAKMSFKLDQSFRQTSEGEWLAEHAHEYGFVIRYPKGKTEVTGYSYEPWHLRYVGKDVSTQIHQQEGTLEEFFGDQPSN